MSYHIAVNDIFMSLDLSVLFFILEVLSKPFITQFQCGTV